ncbi:hypothetical protein AQJ66_05000 [Streptomyces bungoensis]|uniref:Uncharacterized protein n=1 Tax=Streptomyces bungoensis TaxID=285568 RepID=A0A101TBX4_9ACTN|nr:glycoside hydrolase family 75 protein [Streptomyces bungoensis]KUN89512.1 hypothetical protein AQJ66_05000 [Streptomyces bungoensis]
MRVPSLTLAAAGAALLAPTTLPAAAEPPQDRPAARSENVEAPSAVTAAALLDRLHTCTRVSRGRYRTDDGAPARVPVCGTRTAVYWKADLDVDCDGRPTGRCNRRTDPYFSAATAYQESGGRYLNAQSLPYIVLPAPSRIWDHRASGIGGGSVAAVIYRGRVQFAVVGDTGPRDLIGEASYATAKGLGIHPDPLRGGADEDVTYIVFKDARVTRMEDRRATKAAGERLARLFAHGG